jgi:NAD dependent epimerase/dehydratase
MNNPLMGKRVLVTGAGGFIGSSLVDQLVRSGAKVRAFVRYNSRGDPGLLHFSSNDILRKIEIIAGDIKDYHAVLKACEGMEYVFHLSAFISIPYSYIHPFEVIEVNVLGTTNILLACKEYKIEKIIHTSTSEVYGTAQSIPMNEEHPLKAQSPYAASKIGADKIVESFYCSYGLPVITLRPFNTYGPRQSLRAVIPSIIIQALRGKNIRVGNLESIRDFTYIADTVDGFIQAATTAIPFGSTIHLGTGTAVTIAEIINKIGTILGSILKVEVDSKLLRPPHSEVGRLISDNQSAKRFLNWRPKIDLNQGLVETIKWYKEHQDFYKNSSFFV